MPWMAMIFFSPVAASLRYLPLHIHNCMRCLAPAGLYLFNYFRTPVAWKQRVLGCMADPAALATADKRYELDHNDRNTAALSCRDKMPVSLTVVEHRYCRHFSRRRVRPLWRVHGGDARREPPGPAARHTARWRCRAGCGKPHPHPRALNCVPRLATTHDRASREWQTRAFTMPVARWSWASSTCWIKMRWRWL